MRWNKIICVFFFALWAFALRAQVQGGVVLSHDTKNATIEAGFFNNGASLTYDFLEASHGAFSAEFDVNRENGLTIISPSLGYVVYTELWRFQPYSYFMRGADFTVGRGTVFNTSINPGTDFRLTRRYALRFERDFEWTPSLHPQWHNSYEAALVIHL
jgi:hypothetical protein